MSWEGYGQVLCENGHQYSIGQYESEEAQCPFCESKSAWIHWVDQTNGCSCEEDCVKDGTYKCPAHKIPLKELTPVKYEECPTCQHKKVLAQPTYAIPGDK